MVTHDILVSLLVKRVTGACMSLAMQEKTDDFLTYHLPKAPYHLSLLELDALEYL